MAITSFLLGTSTGLWWKHQSPNENEITRMSVPLWVQLMLVFCAIPTYNLLPAPYSQYLFLFFMSMALDIQNGSFSTIGTLNFRTSYITGTSTAFISALLDKELNSYQKMQRLPLALLLLFFAFGALVGGFFYSLI